MSINHSMIQTFPGSVVKFRFMALGEKESPDLMDVASGADTHPQQLHMARICFTVGVFGCEANVLKAGGAPP